MRLLVVSQHYWPEPFNVTDVCETLVARGHEVTVLTGLPNYPEGRVPEGYRGGRNRRQSRNGVEIVRSSLVERRSGAARRVANYLSFARRASRLAKRLPVGFDAVLVNQTSPVLMALPAYAYRRAHGAKVLLYCVDIWPECLLAGGFSKGSLAYRAMLGVSRRIYAAADAVCVTSPGFRDYFEDVLGLDSSGMAVLPQYAEDIFSPDAAAAVDDGAPKLKEGRCNLVFAGNVGAAQSVETIVRAAARLKDDGRIAFHVFGDGTSLAGCEEEARRLGAGNVAFHGRLPLEAMPGVYAQADGMLLTFARDPENITLRCTIPRKLQSYAAAGKPIIAAADGIAARIVEESGCGLRCAAGDDEALAGLCAEFAGMPGKDEMGRRARSLYEERYTKDRFMDTLEKELEKLRA
ncbi:glycosyltransferase family 4 protein [Gordonibacter massiliensis (ex Traore et al. 2017)]|uniref:Glycosyltransferase family 4 protein n=1 Tax=Gordonibacter massiliensis (ex Traore et al. 2017) TaxID=1841863 RepID=A0A842JEQ5_9ACTN|nr:glycosyltransferase family 4 protein [Gordonibacter massiliensis (ex Traore et al. 2017)]MBC2889924.1 glycosyltransferase family 4 protein [Gordonibacter massiliensis (ex Traore et al. 2017)]